MENVVELPPGTIIETGLDGEVHIVFAPHSVVGGPGPGSKIELADGTALVLLEGTALENIVVESEGEKMDTKVYTMTAGKGCPVCDSYGLFYVGDDTSEPDDVAYRCETCLTRFDTDKVPIGSSFIREDGLVDREHAATYFRRWWGKERFDVVKRKIFWLAALLFR